MTERPDATCARCTLTAPRRGVSWPEGYVCRRCYQQATRRRSSCPGCHRDGLLPGLDTQGRPICTGCAGIEQDLTCTRCGEQDEPHRRGLCARCCLRDDLTVLLDNGTGQVAPQLAALLASLVGQPHPRSAVIWLRNPDVRRLLTGRPPRRPRPAHHDRSRDTDHARALMQSARSERSRGRLAAGSVTR
jgi:hypothetical protein